MQRIQAPGAPRLVTVLLSEGRLTQADIQGLRDRYQASQSGVVDSAAPPPQASGAGLGPGGGSDLGGSAEDWDEAMRKDTLLARVLLEQGSVSQDRLRECRQLQVKHHMRLPFGHPEAFIEAFANVYRNAARTMAARLSGEAPGEHDTDFPTVQDGARGVHFIHRAIESGQRHEWVDARYDPPGA